jgi:threonine/homoserine/homoserine lactone efflux protein
VSVLLIGFLLGFAKSIVPLGPTGVLVVQNGLEHRYARAMWIALGGAIAEILYCAGALMGLRALTARHPHVLEALNEAGIAVIAAVGAYMVLRPPHAHAGPPPATDGGRRQLLLGFTTTVLNPTLLFTWSLIVGVLASQRQLRFDEPVRLAFPFTVACGALSCNAAMMLAIRRFRHHLSDRAATMIVRFFGVVLMVVAVWRLIATRSPVSLVGTRFLPDGSGIPWARRT